MAGSFNCTGSGVGSPFGMFHFLIVSDGDAAVAVV